VLWAQAKVFGSSQIRRKILRITRLQRRGQGNVILKLIDWLPGKAITIFDVRGDPHFPWQDRSSPQKEAIRNFSGSAGGDLRSYDRRREVSEITRCIRYITAGKLAHVGKEELPSLARSGACGQFDLSALQRTGTTEYKRTPGGCNFRRKSKLILSIGVNVADPEQDRLVQLMFSLHIPGHTVGCEVSAPALLCNERKP
jgi:hypothetical protein